LVGRAKGILVFPRVTKGGAGVAGEFGEGVLRVNGQNVGYYSLTSASVGLTLMMISSCFATPSARAKTARAPVVYEMASGLAE
jgi:lipid-binding SYLF domain-containing protein